MKIVLAFDKFKGCLAAHEACAAVERGLRRRYPTAEIICRPMGDGGEGTAEALRSALGGEWVTRSVMGPLPGTTRPARYLWWPTEQRACIEMAQASGLAWVPVQQRNPLLTTTYGTGELLADAIQRGARQIWLTVGGSATVDGGVGAAQALGWRFLDAAGQPVGLGGGALASIVTLQPPAVRWPVIDVLCDVENPLCGSHGAAPVFGPQKGATPAMVEQLDAGLCHLAGLVQSQLGKEIRSLPGGGAAGGLAAGAVAFFDARLVSGIETVMTICRLADALQGADWVVTGEGQLDEQSLRGKVVAGVTGFARRCGVPVAVLAGRVLLTEEQWRTAGIDRVKGITPPDLPLPEALRQAPALLESAAEGILA